MTDRDDKRQRVIGMVRKLLTNTVENGCTPGEAAKFAAKASELMEEFNISEIELRIERGGGGFSEDDIDLCQNFLRTGKKVHNPGMTQVVNCLSIAMCCKCILLHDKGEAIYGIIGDRMDADHVCQVATSVVPALQIMAKYEGVEHGREKTALTRWTNQYLTAAGIEIKRRIEEERHSRSEQKIIESSSTALICITGDMIATVKRKTVEDAFNEAYPHTRKSRAGQGAIFDEEANVRGREAGKRIGIHAELSDSSAVSRLRE